VGGWGLGRKLADSSAIYDPATNRWTNAAPIPTPRDHLTAAAVGASVPPGRRTSRHAGTAAYSAYAPRGPV